MNVQFACEAILGRELAIAIIESMGLRKAIESALAQANETDSAAREALEAYIVNQINNHDDQEERWSQGQFGVGA